MSKCCDKCKGDGYVYSQKIIEWTWEHGFKMPKTRMAYKVPCECILEGKK